jgi:hypothetical protein
MGVTTEAQALPADELEEALEVAGVPREVAQASAGIYAEAKYKPKMIKLRPRRFVLKKDAEVSIFEQPHQLRRINPHDIRRLVPVVFNAVMAVLQSRDEFSEIEDIDGLMAQAGPGGIFELLALEGRDEYPDWAVALLEEIGHVASTEALTLEPEDLISLPGDEFPMLLDKLWEVNKQDFLRVALLVWLKVPSRYRAAIGSKISILGSKLGNVLNQPGESSPSLPDPLSSGGTPSGGPPSSSSPSGNTEDSPTLT